MESFVLFAMYLVAYVICPAAILIGFWKLAGVSVPMRLEWHE